MNDPTAQPDLPIGDLPTLPSRIDGRGDITPDLVNDILDHLRQFKQGAKQGPRQEPDDRDDPNDLEQVRDELEQVRESVEAEREKREALADRLESARDTVQQVQASQNELRSDLESAQQSVEAEREKREALESQLDATRETVRQIQANRDELESRLESVETFKRDAEPVVRRTALIRGGGIVDVAEHPNSIEISATGTQRGGGGFRGAFLRLTANNEEGKYDGETVQYSDENGWEVRDDDDRTLKVIDAAGRDDLPLNDGADVNEGAVYHAHPLIDHGTANAGDRVFVIEGDGLRVFPVNLTKDGGSDGDNTTKASWTYTAKSLDDAIEYGTGLNPEDNGGKQRPAVGKVTDGGGKIGLGYFDQNGDFQLYDANEIYTAMECT